MTDNIFLGPRVVIWLSFPLIVLGFIFAIRGRVDLLTGAYLAIVWQNPPVLELGPINLSMVWVLLPVMILSSLVFFQRHRPRLGDQHTSRLLIWLTAWGGWMVALSIAFPIDSANLQTLVSILVLHFAVPFGALALFASDSRWLRGFAFAFVVVNLCLLPNTITTLFGVYNLGDLVRVIALPWWEVNAVYVNYHDFGRVAAVSIVFIVALLADGQTKSRSARGLLAIALGLMAYLLIIATSRQYILGVILVILLMGWWLFRGQVQQKGLVLLTFLLVGGVIVWLFSIMPEYFRLEQLSVGQNEAGFLASRPAIYSEMWEWFLQSPVYGNGLFYVEHLSHNIILDALVAQGIPGLFFLSGLLFFIVRCLRGTWQGTPQNGMSVWRMTAFSVFVIGFISASVSGGVLTSDVLYAGGILIWRLSAVTQPTIVGSQNRVLRVIQPSTDVPEFLSPVWKVD